MWLVAGGSVGGAWLVSNLMVVGGSKGQKGGRMGKRATAENGEKERGQYLVIFVCVVFTWL